MTAAGVLVLTLAVPTVVLLGACSSSEPVPPAAPGAPQVQEVPQMADGGFAVTTFCLAPPGSGLRVFVSHDGHGRAIQVPVNVTDLPVGSPYRCP